MSIIQHNFFNICIWSKVGLLQFPTVDYYLLIDDEEEPYINIKLNAKDPHIYVVLFM